MDEQNTKNPDNLPPGHRSAQNDEYEVIFHPAFASACTVRKNGQGTATDLYRQGNSQADVIDCSDGHPEKHVIRIRGKGDGRDITITVHDPSHTLHSISFDLYREARDRTVKRQPGAQVYSMAGGEVAASGDVGETFTLENDAKTCPPYCDPTNPG